MKRFPTRHQPAFALLRGVFDSMTVSAKFGLHPYGGILCFKAGQGKQHDSRHNRACTALVLQG